MGIPTGLLNIFVNVHICLSSDMNFLSLEIDCHVYHPIRSKLKSSVLRLISDYDKVNGNVSPKHH